VGNPFGRLRKSSLERVYAGNADVAKEQKVVRRAGLKLTAAAQE
jgi:hypothetical protein